MVIDSDIYREQGVRQGQRQEPLLAVRGNIYDTKNTPLTRNIIHYSLGAHPSKVKNKSEFANLISQSTDREPDYYLKRLS